MKKDLYLIGAFNVDNDQSHDGKANTVLGGPGIFSAYAAMAGGRTVGMLTKMAPKDTYLLQPLYIRDLTVVADEETTSCRVVYKSADKEKRNIYVDSCSSPITPEEMPDVESEIFQLAGVLNGSIDNRMFAYLAKKGKLACDLQNFLRYNENGEIVQRDWAEKKELLPYVTYLKADAAEAEVITGLTDRKEAAKLMYQWGAKEILITHNSEVIVYDGKEFYSYPLRPRNLQGRSGRGDTTFASYITERIDHSPAEALFYASAMVSLKMEKVGPFKGTRADVEAFQKEYYSEYC